MSTSRSQAFLKRACLPARICWLELLVDSLECEVKVHARTLFLSETLISDSEQTSDWAVRDRPSHPARSPPPSTSGQLPSHMTYLSAASTHGRLQLVTSVPMHQVIFHLKQFH